MAFAAYGLRRIQGGRMRGMHILPPATLENVFHVYNFSIISSLSIAMSLRPEARIIENVRTKCIIFSEALRIRVKKLSINKIWLKIIQNALKWPLEHVHFQKSFGGACPRTSLEPFLFLHQLQISSAEKKKTLENNVEIMPPSPLSTPLSAV